MKPYPGVAVAVAVTYCASYIIINMANGAQGVDAFRNVISGILYGQKREVLVYIVMDLCALAIVAGAVAGWKPLKMMERPMLIAIGQASYGGYLLHALVLLGMGEVIGSAVASRRA